MSLKPTNLMGKEFGRLTVINYEGRNSKNQHIWKCECSCTKTKIVSSRCLMGGNTKSCGCLQNDWPQYELEGKMFDRWKVISRTTATTGKRGRTYWLCECQCENKILREVKENSLLTGISKSCGCINKEKQKEKNQKRFNDYVGMVFGELTVMALLEKSKDGKIPYRCKCNCGNFRDVYLKELKNKNITHCADIKHKHILKGEEHPNWNPSLTHEDRQNSLHRTKNPKVREWRNKILSKNQYRCQLSGRGGCYLEVHHLYSWHSNPSLRFDLNNGVPLREDLHKLFHKIYGQKNNTAAQFEEFERRYHNLEFDKRYY